VLLPAYGDDFKSAFRRASTPIYPHHRPVGPGEWFARKPKWVRMRPQRKARSMGIDLAFLQPPLAARFDGVGEGLKVTDRGEEVGPG